MLEGSGNSGGKEHDIDLLALARSAFEIGQARWPDVVLDWERFEAYFRQHAKRGDTPSNSAAADMYLACSCAHGLPRALAALESILMLPVARAIASVDPTPTFVEEVVQATREHLLVPEGGGLARIGEYAGRCSLKNWLSTVAVRRAISQLRGQARGRRAVARGQGDMRLVRGSPELDYLRHRYKGVFEEAIRHSIAQLPRQQRLLLRLNLVEGMSIDGLATAYSVGRSTAARWLVQARRVLFESVRRELHARLKLSAGEIDSMAHDIRSQLEVSILRLLASEPRPGAARERLE